MVLQNILKWSYKNLLNHAMNTYMDDIKVSQNIFQELETILAHTA